MTTEIKKEEGKILMTVSGRIDTTTSDEFKETIEKVASESATEPIEIDCTELVYVSSQGLRCFLLLQKAVSGKGGSLVLKNLKPEVKEVFDITGFSNIICIE